MDYRAGVSPQTAKLRDDAVPRGRGCQGESKESSVQKGLGERGRSAGLKTTTKMDGEINSPLHRALRIGVEPFLVEEEDAGGEREEHHGDAEAASRSLGERAGLDRSGKDGLPGLFAVGALDFAGSSVVGAGTGIQCDRVFLAAVGTGQIDQNVEWG
jgi:hypothetical protein